jgi:hypothetical protein
MILLTTIISNDGEFMSFKVHKQLLGLTLIGALSVNAALANPVASTRSISSTLSRNSETIQALFNDYQYEMDDWNGSDFYYKKDADTKLSEGLKDLLKDKVSIKEIQTEMENRILNPRKKENLFLH